MNLLSEVYAEASSWFTSLSSDLNTRILQHYGEFPPPDLADDHQNGPAWMWYTTSILPLDPQIQLAILAKTSLRDRLVTLRRWIARVRSSFVTMWLGINTLVSDIAIGFGFYAALAVALVSATFFYLTRSWNILQIHFKLNFGKMSTYWND